MVAVQWSGTTPSVSRHHHRFMKQKPRPTEPTEIKTTRIAGVDARMEAVHWTGTTPSVSYHTDYVRKPKRKKTEFKTTRS